MPIRPLLAHTATCGAIGRATVCPRCIPRLLPSPSLSAALAHSPQAVRVCCLSTRPDGDPHAPGASTPASWFDPLANPPGDPFFVALWQSLLDRALRPHSPYPLLPDADALFNAIESHTPPPNYWLFEPVPEEKKTTPYPWDVYIALCNASPPGPATVLRRRHFDAMIAFLINDWVVQYAGRVATLDRVRRVLRDLIHTPVAVLGDYSEDANRDATPPNSRLSGAPFARSLRYPPPHPTFAINVNHWRALFAAHAGVAALDIDAHLRDVVALLNACISQLPDPNIGDTPARDDLARILQVTGTPARFPWDPSFEDLDYHHDELLRQRGSLLLDVHGQNHDRSTRSPPQGQDHDRFPPSHHSKTRPPSTSTISTFSSTPFQLKPALSRLSDTSHPLPPLILLPFRVLFAQLASHPHPAQIIYPLQRLLLWMSRRPVLWALWARHRGWEDAAVAVARIEDAGPARLWEWVVDRVVDGAETGQVDDVDDVVGSTDGDVDPPGRGRHRNPDAEAWRTIAEDTDSDAYELVLTSPKRRTGLSIKPRADAHHTPSYSALPYGLAPVQPHVVAVLLLASAAHDARLNGEDAARAALWSARGAGPAYSSLSPSQSQGQDQGQGPLLPRLLSVPWITRVLSPPKHHTDTTAEKAAQIELVTYLAVLRNRHDALAKDLAEVQRVEEAMGGLILGPAVCAALAAFYARHDPYIAEPWALRAFAVKGWKGCASHFAAMAWARVGEGKNVAQWANEGNIEAKSAAIEVNVREARKLLGVRFGHEDYEDERWVERGGDGRSRTDDGDGESNDDEYEDVGVAEDNATLRRAVEHLQRADKFMEKQYPTPSLRQTLSGISSVDPDHRGIKYMDLEAARQLVEGWRMVGEEVKMRGAVSRAEAVGGRGVLDGTVCYVSLDSVRMGPRWWEGIHGWVQGWGEDEL